MFATSFEVIAEPEAEPLSLDLARAWARLDTYGTPPGHPLDPLLTAVLIPGARKTAQQHCGRAFGVQTVRLSLDAFPRGAEGICLPLPPAVEVLSVAYVDPDGDAQTLPFPSLYLDRAQEPAWLLPGYGYAWPSVREQANAVTIEYRCGHAAVPEPVLHAMMLLVTAGIENPSEVSERQTYALAHGVEALLQPYVCYAGRVPRGLAR